MLATPCRSSSVRILLVAWRASASGRSSLASPEPSSSTCTRLAPPWSSVTWISFAPASRAFSSSSLSTEAGRSTTSPAAIWLISRSGRTRMWPMRGVYRIASWNFSRRGGKSCSTSMRISPSSSPRTAPGCTRCCSSSCSSRPAWSIWPFLPGDSLLFVTGAHRRRRRHGHRRGDGGAGRRSAHRRQRQLLHRPLGRAARVPLRAVALVQPEAPGARACVLRAPWRQDHHPGALHPDRAHLRAVRRRHRQHALRALSSAGASWARWPGWSRCAARVTSSATCRSSRTTSAW